MCDTSTSAPKVRRVRLRNAREALGDAFHDTWEGGSSAGLAAHDALSGSRCSETASLKTCLPHCDSAHQHGRSRSHHAAAD